MSFGCTLMPLFSRKKDDSANNDSCSDIFPVTAFRLTHALLKSQYSREPSDLGQAVWQGRTLCAVTSLLPYVESVFSEYRPTPGVDITDTACKKRYESLAAFGHLERALELSAVKAWLSFHEGEPGWDDLYQMVFHIPGFESLSTTNHSERMNYEFVLMPVKQILLDLVTSHRALIEPAN